MVRPLLLTALLLGCPRTLENSGDRLSDGSLACDFDRGVEHLWRLSKNLPPLFDTPPAPGPGWTLFQDPVVPLLGFMHPPDWSATPISQPEMFGVTLRDPGRTAEQTILYVMYPRPDLSAAEIVEHELSTRTQGAEEVRSLCTDSGTFVQDVGQDYRMEVVVADDTIVFVAASVIFDPGHLGYGPGVTLNAGINVFAGDVRDFHGLTEDVFLPIIWQLMFTGGSEPDTDGDGTPDSEDRFPFDPERQ